MRSVLFLAQVGLLLGCQSEPASLVIGVSGPIAVGTPSALVSELTGPTEGVWSASCGADCQIDRDASGVPISVTPGHAGTYEVRVTFTDLEGAVLNQPFQVVAYVVDQIVFRADETDVSTSWPEAAPLALGLELSRTPVAYSADGTALATRPHTVLDGDLARTRNGSLLVVGDGSITASLAGASATLRVHGVTVPPDGPFELHPWRDGVMDPVALPAVYEASWQDQTTFLLTTAPDAQGIRTLVPTAYVTARDEGVGGIDPGFQTDPTIRIMCIRAGTTSLVAATATVLTVRCVQ